MGRLRYPLRAVVGMVLLGMAIVIPTTATAATTLPPVRRLPTLQTAHLDEFHFSTVVADSVWFQLNIGVGAFPNTLARVPPDGGEPQKTKTPINMSDVLVTESAVWLSVCCDNAVAWMPQGATSFTLVPNSGNWGRLAGTTGDTVWALYDTWRQGGKPDETLAQYDATSGAERWRMDFVGGSWNGRRVQGTDVHADTVIVMLRGGALHIDPNTHTIAFHAREARAPTGRVAPPDGASWWENDNRHVIQIDATTGRTIANFAVGTELGNVVELAGSLWATNSVHINRSSASDEFQPSRDNWLLRIDPLTGRVTDRFALPNRNQDAFARGRETPTVVVDAGALWVGFGPNAWKVDLSATKGA